MFKTKNLYQNDERWKETSLGYSDETIGGWGCLLTSVTMMVNGLGYDETPLTVNDKMKANGGFQGAFLIPSVIPYIFPNIRYNSMQQCQTFPVPLDQIDAEVSVGKPVILQVDWTRQAGIQTHFVLVKDRVGDDYSLYDPYRYPGDSPDKPVLLTTRYKYRGKTLKTEITAVLWFDDTTHSEPPEPLNLPVLADAMTLFVIEGDLALRAEPRLDGYLWKRMTAGSELKSLESSDSTRSKLGQPGQWLQVQEVLSGQQGYTAAWYVSTNKDATPVSKSSAATVRSGTAVPTNARVPVPPGAMSLIPTADVALRTQQVIDPSTLIRRVAPVEKLISLEPVDQTIKKVGVKGQWIHVQEQKGRQGYVAAWYVKYESGANARASAPATAPTQLGPVKVRTTVELVALRKKPVVAASTLIEYLSIGTELTIIEPGGEQKIGANNQWINVRGEFGTEGFIAAWFVVPV
jgi:hypothetical protein